MVLAERREMLETIKNLIYPPKCGICGKLNKKYLCRECKKKLERYAICEILENRNPYIFFDEQISIFSYKSLIRNEILSFKFGEASYLYKTFVNFLIKNQKVFQKIKSYDIIIPVPISKKRKRERGYNQSLLIAREISKNTNIEIAQNCLYKTKNTIEQSKLNREEREKNVQNVYTIKNEQILENKKILLIDDILTTGNTLNSCSKELKKGKPDKIGVLVLAKD